MKAAAVALVVIINFVSLQARWTEDQTYPSERYARDYSAELRCDVSEISDGTRMARATNVWKKTNLKYHIWYSRDRSLSYAVQEEVMRRAFAEWSKASSKLNFTQTYCLHEADIKISFSDKVIHAGPGEEPCKYRHLVPKLSRTIGHAFGPNDGRIHFNDMEDWNYKASPIYTDVYAVALHFIGHMLGLRHSQASDSVMWTRYTKFRQELSQDDIIKIRNLYGL